MKRTFLIIAFFFIKLNNILCQDNIDTTLDTTSSSSDNNTTPETTSSITEPSRPVEPIPPVTESTRSLTSEQPRSSPTEPIRPNLSDSTTSNTPVPETNRAPETPPRSEPSRPINPSASSRPSTLSSPEPTTEPASANRRPAAFRSGISTINGVATRSNEELGDFLTNDEGYALYANLKDGPNTITCYGDCLRRWPPAIITENQRLSLSEDIKGDKLMNMPADDGRLQLTYFDYPLYYNVKDVEPGQIRGQGLDNFYLISPSGQLLKPDSRGRVQPARTNNNTTSTNTTDTDIASSQTEQSLTICGDSKMYIIPDLFSIKISVNSTGDTFQLADERNNKILIKLNSTLSGISSLDSQKIVLIDKFIAKENSQITVREIYYFVSESPDTINSIITAINDIKMDDTKKINFEIGYSISRDYITKVKEYLFPNAFRKAVDNVFDTLDPIKKTINKSQPISSVNLDNSEMKSIVGFYNLKNSYFIPSLVKEFNMMMSCRVCVSFNIN